MTPPDFSQPFPVFRHIALALGIAALFGIAFLACVAVVFTSGAW